MVIDHEIDFIVPAMDDGKLAGTIAKFAGSPIITERMETAGKKAMEIKFNPQDNLSLV